MKKLVVSCFALISALGLMAQDKTLRVDYIFSGTDKIQEIALDEMSCFAGWAGRRVNTDTVPVRGNGQITLTDIATGNILYRQSFSTLFQEWQSTEEATRVAKSFENSFLIPMPKEKVQVTVELKNMHNGTKSYLKHTVDPADRLISKHAEKETLPYSYLHKAGNSKEKIDIVFVPEGYTKDEMKQFRKDCMESMESIFRHQPFNRLKNRFNFIAVEVPSEREHTQEQRLEKHGSRQSLRHVL